MVARVAVLGAAGLANCLALKGTLSNVAAGAMLVSSRAFKVGDAVKHSGEVYVFKVWTARPCGEDRHALHQGGQQRCP